MEINKEQFFLIYGLNQLTGSLLEGGKEVTKLREAVGGVRDNTNAFLVLERLSIDQVDIDEIIEMKFRLIDIFEKYGK